MNYEVELKFPLVDTASIAAQLEQKGVVWQPPCEQVDIYLNHPKRDYARTDEALRIRSVGGANVITYKGPKLDATTKTRRELELPLAAGGDMVSQYVELLTALGFRSVREVRKQRRPGELNFAGQSIHVAWDEVTGLGTYLELELCVSAEQAAVAQQTLTELAAELKLLKSERRSYLELLEANSSAGG